MNIETKIIIKLVIIGGLLGCKKNDDKLDFPPYDKLDFQIEFFQPIAGDSLSIGFKAYTVYVDYMKVFINDIRYNELENEDGVWQYTKIPYSKTIKYEVVTQDESITGNYTIPDDYKGDFFCNGLKLIDGEDNYLTKNDSYVFSWEYFDIDQLYIFLDNDGYYYRNSIEDTSIVVNNYSYDFGNAIGLNIRYIDIDGDIKGEYGVGEISTIFKKWIFIEFID